MGIQSYSYTDQRKVEADVEVTEDRTGDLSLRKPRTSQLSHDCSLLEDLNFNQGQCESLGRLTQEQSKSSNWVGQQKGRITASSLHNVHTKVSTLLAVKTRPL